MYKKVLRDNFSKSAEYYDDHAKIQKHCAMKLIEDLKGRSFKNILEIGCGTGEYTRLLRETFPEARITAVDMSEKSLEVARRKVPDENMQFIAADAERLLLDEKFDLITSNAALQWFEDLERTFSLMKKMLAQDGVFCIAMYGPQTFNEFEDILRFRLGHRPWLSSCGFIGNDRLKDVLGRNFGAFELKEEHFTQNFDSLWDFISSIKMTGSRGKGIGDRVFLGKMTIHNLEQDYIQKYGDIIATHHVFFCKSVA